MKRTWAFSLLSVLAVVSLSALAWQYDPQKLPPPFATPSVNNGPRVITRPDGAQLRLPQGFDIEVFAENNFQRPRFMLQVANGILLADSASGPDGKVWLLRGTDKATWREPVLEGLDRPYGLAVWKDYLYVAETTSVKRYKYDAEAMKVSGKGEEVIAYPEFGRGHWTRSLLFDRDGKKLYVGVGSGSNVNAGEDPRRAAINRYNPDGSGHEIFASGTRNPIGLHWYPNSDTLWAAVQERDALGDDLVPDYFTHLDQGTFYGWPYAYTGPNEDPRRKGEHPDLVKKTLVGDVLLGSHVAVLDYIFYTGKQFPEKYQGGALLAFHGSWNRSKRVGYSIAFVPFKNGKPAGPLEDFLTGFMLSPEKREVWGRPVALLQMPDGSILLSDDGGNKIWRIAYKR